MIPRQAIVSKRLSEGIDPGQPLEGFDRLAEPSAVLVDRRGGRRSFGADSRRVCSLADHAQFGFRHDVFGFFVAQVAQRELELIVSTRSGPATLTRYQ